MDYLLGELGVITPTERSPGRHARNGFDGTSIRVVSHWTVNSMALGWSVGQLLVLEPSNKQNLTATLLYVARFCLYT